MTRSVKLVLFAVLAVGLTAGCVGQLVVLPDVPTTLVWSDSFEDDIVGEFPTNWDLAGGTYEEDKGPRVVDASVLPMIDGYKALKLYNGNQALRIRHEFGPIEKGRVEAYVWAFPDDDSARGQAEIDVYAGSNRAMTIFLQRDAELRYRDAESNSTQAHGGKVTLERGAWHKLAIEWDAAARVFHGFYYNAAGELVRITPPGGVPFPDDVVDTPDTVRLGVAGTSNSEEHRSAYFDAIAVFAIEE